MTFLDVYKRQLRELCPFIGPPLKDSFMEFYQFTEAQAEEAVKKYRERYSETGPVSYTHLDVYKRQDKHILYGLQVAAGDDK